MVFEKEIILLIAVITLIIYLFATKDYPYVPIKDRINGGGYQQSKRRVINYYGWKGPMFIEDFTSENPYQETVPVSRPNPYLTPHESKGCTVPKYNKSDKMKYCHRAAKNKCRVPTLTSEQDWYNEYWNSTYMMTGPSDEGSLCKGPQWSIGDPGNYRQATNNNLDFPMNLKCQARSTNKDFCHPRDKVSPKCYASSIKECLEELE